MTTIGLTDAQVQPPRRGFRRVHAIRHSWAMTKRNLTHVIRSPEQISIYFSVPIMSVLVFGYVFGSGMDYCGYWRGLGGIHALAEAGA